MFRRIKHLQQRALHRVVIENDEQREYRVEEPRRQDERRRRGHNLVISPRNKEKLALKQPFQSKQALGGKPLCLDWQKPLALREQTSETSTVISRSRLDLSNYPCALESRNFAVSMPLLK
ncbi:hypothetical protein J6590_091025 [Homalodisca vitripennis]|nr:hypothetical protein J6590_091025 [Homalodisca vitripennis]